MKFLFYIFFVFEFNFYLLTCSLVYAQNTYEEWMEKGKYEYSHTNLNNLKAAENAFKKAIELQPQSAEAWYRLALTYQKMFCSDFDKIEDYKKHHAEILFNTYQKVIEYSQNQINLSDLSSSPYEMINNAWGRLALAYWNVNKLDSLKWALQEFSKLYFYPEILEMAQNILNETEPNSILFVNSENLYYYILYTQTLQNYRKDVQVIYFEGLNAVWYDVWLQNVYFPHMNISKDEIEENSKTQIYENELFFSHYQIRSKLVFPFSSQWVLSRASWFFYKILQHNAFRYPVYAIASFDNEIIHTMKNHWAIVGMTKKFFFNVPNRPYEEMFSNVQTWKLHQLQALKGDIIEYSLKKLQFYRMPFIHYIYNNLNVDNELVKRTFIISETVLPESILPMPKDLKKFFIEIKKGIGL